ncbi:MAG TPA: MBL fold metallo-hydrolase [Candidatus Binataceae bacterium]|nr:MBL fold metallo-hydrolase [Candidatus Binataceae bacterium]
MGSGLQKTRKVNAGRVTVLGAGDAFASKGRFQAGYVISAGGTQILMDAGPTLLSSMKRLGMSPDDIDVVLISHLHGDHFCGLAFLILEYLYEAPRQRRLTLAGPPHLEERTWALFRSMYPESDTTEIARQLDFVVLEPERTQQVNGTIQVQSIRTRHTIKDISLAYRVKVGGKAIVFSGDTGWTDDLIPLSAGADLFLCECTYFDQPGLDFHISYTHFMTQRHRLSPHRLVLTHIGREVLERESDVAVEMAIDGMVIEV